jgi:uncharacterized membrane protein YkoI
MMKQLLLAATAFLAVLGSHAATAGEEPCFTDWSVAAPIVKKEGLVSVERLSDLVRAKLKAHIIKATLCSKDGGYVFHVVIRPEKGKMRTITVNARKPFEN